MTNTNNTGTIYKVLERAGSILRSDIKSLSDLSSMIVEDISINIEDSKKVSDSVEKNKDILHEIESMARSLSNIDNLLSQKISQDYEPTVILELLKLLNDYGMLDISYSSKGKITIDLKHCEDIEKL